MLALGLLFTAMVPLVAGLPWTIALQSSRGPGGWPLALVHGYVLGLLIVVAGMRVANIVDLPINVLTAAVLPAAVGALGWWRVSDALARARTDAAAMKTTWISLGRTPKVFFAVLLSLVLLRLLVLGVEMLPRPLFPWEAVSAVAAKARVWYEAGRLVPFVSPAGWLEGVGSYTDADPAAFALPSLLLVWTANALGQWHEGAVGFVWWLLGAGLTLAIYGHMRRSGAGLIFSLTACYLFLSLPLIDLHIALAGAPQWIGAVGIGLAGCAVLGWLRMPSRELIAYGVIGALLALASVASTWSWLSIFAIAVAIRMWRSAAVKLAAGVPLLLLLALLALMQTPIKYADTVWQVQVARDWLESVESLFLLDNWHLLYGLALVAAMAGWRFLASPTWLPMSWVMGMGLCLVFIKGALSVPPAWHGGFREFSFTALQFAPMLVLWTAWVARAIVGGASVSDPSPSHEAGGSLTQR